MTCTGIHCRQGRAPEHCDCGNLVTENSDGSDPHAETKDAIDLVLDALYVGIPLLIVGLVLYAYAF